MNKSEFRIIAVSIGILFLVSVTMSVQERSNPISIMVIPAFPKNNEPVLVSFTLSNPSQHESAINYEFYSDGILLMKGKELLDQQSSKKFNYLYPDSPEMGEKITFLLKTESDDGSYDKSVSIPSYQPQVWSSFVSFASITTSIITTEQYSDGSFGDKNHLNVGLIFSIVLILLLIYLELTEPVKEFNHKILNKLGIRFNRLAVVLFIIFVGMVFTRVVMILV